MSSLLPVLCFHIFIHLFLPSSCIMAGPWRRTELFLNCDITCSSKGNLALSSILFSTHVEAFGLLGGKKMLCPGLSYANISKKDEVWSLMSFLLEKNPTTGTYWLFSFIKSIIYTFWRCGMFNAHVITQQTCDKGKICSIGQLKPTPWGHK